jgi:urease accessory protein
MSIDDCTPGAGRLTVEWVAGASAVTSVRAASPLKILTPRPRGPSVWASLGTLGGGLVAGDNVAVSLKLGEGTRCFVTTQASTKIYRNPPARPCSHFLRAEVGPGALLALSPDPVQAFAESSYQQTQEFVLAPESGLVFVDWLCAGRTARGERWAFRRYHSRNEIHVGQSRVLLDSLLLEPTGSPLAAAYRLGRFNCLALVVVMGGLLRSASASLVEDIGRRPVPRRAPLLVSASAVAEGALIRLAGESVEDLAAEIQRLLAFVPSLLQEDPWSRKW